MLRGALCLEYRVTLCRVGWGRRPCLAPSDCPSGLLLLSFCLSLVLFKSLWALLAFFLLAH